jgi:hypothetical protein
VKLDQAHKWPLEEGGWMKERGGKLIRIRGIVIPTEWDEQGNVAAVSIAAHNEEEYRVGMDDKGKELVVFLREQVEVSGFVREHQDKKIIKVERYSLRRA